VQALKDDEEAVKVLRINADAIIRDGEDPFVTLSLAREVNARRLLAVELDGIADEVLKQLHQLRPVAHHGGQGIMSHRRLALLYHHLEVM